MTRPVANPWGLPAGDLDDPVLVTTLREGVPDVIDTPDALAEAARRLAGSDAPIALDVERAQGFRYGADPYLVQIRREDVGTVLVDTAALPDLSTLRAALDGTWLLHDAEQDIVNLRSVGLDTRDLFDTEIAARLVGLRRFGLNATCEQILGLSLAKEHQANNWSVRPLPTGWLRYAALDVEMLSALHARLGARLDALGRWEWAREEFEHARTRPAPAPKPDRWRSAPGRAQLKSRRNLAVLRALWETRERLARDLDLAPSKLVRTPALVAAAARPPRTRRDLLALNEFRSPVARRYVDEWMRAVSEALRLPAEELPTRHARTAPGAMPSGRQWQHVDREAHERLTVIRAAIADVAGGLDLEPDVVLEPRVQRFLAWAPLDTSRPTEDAVDHRLEEGGARHWQRDLTVDALARALSSPHGSHETHP